MPEKNDDLHGMVPDRGPVALLLIDVVNDFDFPTGEQLLLHALPLADRLIALKHRCQNARIPVIYVNDNFGRWQSDQRTLVEHCLRDGARGQSFVRVLLPAETDYFVLKPKHSGFFSTTLDTLLGYLKARTLILAGLTGDICVLFTANDAFMREYHLVVPSDCTVSADTAENEHALAHMRRVLNVDTTPSANLDLGQLLHKEAATG
ncbi:MAG TPA: isochorismatase family cysteine hydrolase [Chloroflexota bacterium]|nr:isochorismatase family cysteine hydrolase [Chloroflexota bacterium]